MQNFNIIADLCRSADGFVSILGGNHKGRFFSRQSKKVGKGQESIQPSPTPNQGYHIGN